MNYKILFALLISLILLNFGLSVNSSNEPPSNNSYISSIEFEKPTIQNYQPHPAINISSDSDFVDLGFPGIGDQQNPYMIEGLEIIGSESVRKLISIKNVNSTFTIKNNRLVGNGSEKLNVYQNNIENIQKLIYIENTNSPFIIENNLLFGNDSDGIYLNKVSSASIEYNIIETTNIAINSVNSSQIIIINNVISKSTWVGISILESLGVQIINNSIINKGEIGIDIKSHNVVIENNTIEGGSFAGIKASNRYPIYYSNLTVSSNTINNTLHGIYWQTQDSIISENQILNSKGNGILLQILDQSIQNGFNNNFSNNLISSANLNGIAILGADSNTFTNNTIIDSGFSGISVSGSSGLRSKNNFISRNEISYSDDYGIRIGYSAEENSIIGNNFQLNNNGGIQGYDEDEKNKFQLNYWDDWTGPDSDVNGIVDAPYIFEGNSDPYPRVSIDSNYEILEQNIPFNTVKITIIDFKTDGATKIETETQNLPEFHISTAEFFLIILIIGVVSFKVYQKYQKKSFPLNRCPSCNSRYPPGSVYCGECGAEVEI
ncbi:MAG: hypothetical protein HeimC2_13410 [Candidatus Heimdallarchaeota archaeon LC_2]|nr:MAG: hypothetical protein HeimC2_13410 [Candidatus Heimdallarchaeota archaeon LC_2]